jgi:anti-anti-sigma factor
VFLGKVYGEVMEMSWMSDDGFLEVRTASGGHAVIVTPRGDIDLRTAPHLERALRRAVEEHRIVFLDLRDVTYIDMSGVRAIESAVPQGAPAELIAVVFPSSIVEKVVLLAGMSDVVRVLHRLDDAGIAATTARDASSHGEKDT